jgi:hypothetical protein
MSRLTSINMEALPYIPGTSPINPGPLERFLPPLEEGTVSAWLVRNVKPDEWLLDPFGFSPRLAVEAARSGYRVLVTSNNPITRFLLEISASAPNDADLKSALAELGASRKGDERLETHLQNLYLTPCEKCGKEIQALSFLWRKSEDVPYARVYECTHCEDKGERTITSVDIERAQNIGRSASLHRARVLERVAPVNDPDREYAEEALQAYLPRAIYALATLVNRLDGLNTSEERRRLITALILVACDAANSLHSHDRPRPKQLTVSNQFRENNVWMALENGINLFSETSSKVPFEAWPKKIPEGGICIFDGRLKSLAEEVRKEIPIAAVIGAIPRPNQAFWTLCALWSGWLWGREAAEPFKIGLRRRRYDWAWSATALNSAFRHLNDLLPLGTASFCLLPEPEPSFLTSALTSANAAGFDLKGLAMRTEHDPIQIVWQRGEHLIRETGKPDLETVRGAIIDHLTQRGEPASYLHIHTAGLIALNQGHALRQVEQEFDEAMRLTQSTIEAALKGDPRFIHYSSGEGVGTGMWGLHTTTYSNSLADRVEMEIVDFLQKETENIFLEIENNLYENFPGLLTPSKVLIYQVLNSYATKKAGAWQLRDEDKPSNRRSELKRINESLESLGARLGYSARKEDKAVLWMDKETTARVLYTIASAIVSRVLDENVHPSQNCILAIPGGRAALVAYKQQRDPALAEKMRGWKVMKFRLARALSDIPVLTRETFEEQISSDPVEKAEGQLMMF